MRAALVALPTGFLCMLQDPCPGFFEYGIQLATFIHERLICKHPTDASFYWSRAVHGCHAARAVDAGARGLFRALAEHLELVGRSQAVPCMCAWRRLTLAGALHAFAMTLLFAILPLFFSPPSVDILVVIFSSPRCLERIVRPWPHVRSASLSLSLSLSRSLSLSATRSPQR